MYPTNQEAPRAGYTSTYESKSTKTRRQKRRCGRQERSEMDRETKWVGSPSRPAWCRLENLSDASSTQLPLACTVGQTTSLRGFQVTRGNDAAVVEDNQAQSSNLRTRSETSEGDSGRCMSFSIT